MADEPFRKCPSEDSSGKSLSFLHSQMKLLAYAIFSDGGIAAVKLQVDLQGVVHLGEGLLGLLKETKDNGPAERVPLLLVIHLQDLLKRRHIDAVAQVREADGTVFALLLCASAPSV